MDHYDNEPWRTAGETPCTETNTRLLLNRSLAEKMGVLIEAVRGIGPGSRVIIFVLGFIADVFTSHLHPIMGWELLLLFGLLF